MANMDKALLLKMYKEMCLARLFEERLVELYMDGQFSGMLHPSIGEEACGVGTVNALDPEDFLGLHHRNHPHMIARGCDMSRMMAEVLCKETGFCMGKAGDVHIMDMERHAIALGGTLGACFTVPMGPAHYYKFKKLPNIAVAYSGDSSTAEGPFHEALNMSKAYNLPVLFVIQNNCYGMSTRITDVTGGISKISTRAKGYEIPALCVDGNDVENVYYAAKTAAEYVRGGNGPMMLELMTWRQKGHGVADADNYKDPAEQAAWLARDPLKLCAEKLKTRYAVSQEELDNIHRTCAEEVAAMEKFAEESPDTPAEVAFMHMEASV